MVRESEHQEVARRSNRRPSVRQGPRITTDRRADRQSSGVDGRVSIKQRRVRRVVQLDEAENTRVRSRSFDRAGCSRGGGLQRDRCRGVDDVRAGGVHDREPSARRRS